MICLGAVSCTSPIPDTQTSHVESTPNPSHSTSATHTHRQLELDGVRSADLHKHPDIQLNALEPGEVCVINANEVEANKVDRFAHAHGYTKKKRRTLPNLGVVMSIYNAPAGENIQASILVFQKAFPSHIVDANHHYYLQNQSASINPHLYGHHLIGWTEQTMHCATQNISIGMIDTAVNMKHLPTQHRTIQTKAFIPANAPKPQNYHGTAVATLLVGQTQSTNQALLPRAALFVAEAFRQKEAGKTEATTWSIVRALDWLVEQQVQVINLSLGGPSNALLRYAIKATLNEGIPIVAAGGNAGPGGHPVYPAAQPGVIAVTALDVRLQPYRFANQGSYITFSAPGVDIWIPQEDGNGTFQSGTSFATPFVTTATAAVKQAHPQWTPDQIAHQLAITARDLGTTGKDNIYGWGLIQLPQLCRKEHSSLNTQSYVSTRNS